MSSVFDPPWALRIALAIFVAFAGAAMAVLLTGGAEKVDGAQNLVSETVPAPEEAAVPFCPSSSQTDRHLGETGKDYKPTVFCAADDEPDDRSFGSDADDLPDTEREAFEDSSLRSAEPAADEDGDPLTIEGKLPDGSAVVAEVFGNPERFEGTDIDELAELLAKRDRANAP